MENTGESDGGVIVKAGLTAEDPVLDEIVRRLVASYQPFGVYLFGFQASLAGPLRLPSLARWCMKKSCIGFELACLLRRH